MKNKSILIIDKNYRHPLEEMDKMTEFETKSLLGNRLMQSVSKVVVVDGDRYNVIKSRHGKATQNGHVSDLKEEMNT